MYWNKNNEGSEHLLVAHSRGTHTLETKEQSKEKQKQQIVSNLVKWSEQISFYFIENV